MEWEGGIEGGTSSKRFMIGFECDESDKEGMK